MMIYPVFTVVLFTHLLDFALIQTLNLPGQAGLALDIFNAYHGGDGSQVI